MITTAIFTVKWSMCFCYHWFRTYSKSCTSTEEERAEQRPNETAKIQTSTERRICLGNWRCDCRTMEYLSVHLCGVQKHTIETFRKKGTRCFELTERQKQMGLSSFPFGHLCTCISMYLLSRCVDFVDRNRLRLSMFMISHPHSDDPPSNSSLSAVNLSIDWFGWPRS